MDRYIIAQGASVYFVTFTVIYWMPVFIEDQSIAILIESLKYCITQKDLRLQSYVIMPNHMHAVVFDANGDSNNLHQTLVSFRKFTGQNLSNYLDGKYSKAISSVLSGGNLEDRSRRFWQSGWHAEEIFSNKFLEQKVNYLHDNPCRKGLVRSPQDWRYSSAAFWLDGTSVDLPVTGLDWEE